MTEDRTYIRTTGAWHAFVTWTRVPTMVRVLCGRTLSGRTIEDINAVLMNDRVPSDGHLCGNCGRLIAAHTDIEGE